MAKIGLNFSKPEKFVRTPLYYALVSHENMCFMVCQKIFHLILSWPRFAIIIYIHSGILIDEYFSCKDSNIDDVIKYFTTANLKEDVSDDKKWSKFQTE